MKPADTSKIHNCIPDEHYVQTLLAVRILFFSNLHSFCFCLGNRLCHESDLLKNDSIYPISYPSVNNTLIQQLVMS